jgi:hypothetical protein
MTLRHAITAVAVLLSMAAAWSLAVPAAHSTHARVQHAEVVTIFWSLKMLFAFAAKCAAVGAIVVTVAYLTWPKLTEWLRNRFQLNQPNRIAVSMLEKMQNGEYQFCAVGIDKELNEVVGEAAIRSTSVAPELEALYKKRAFIHQGQEG